MENHLARSKMEALSKRAEQRRKTHPAVKTEEDAKIENTAFDTLKEQVYKNAVRGEAE